MIVYCGSGIDRFKEGFHFRPGVFEISNCSGVVGDFMVKTFDSY
jgi:hypothetical protein